MSDHDSGSAIDFRYDPARGARALSEMREAMQRFFEALQPIADALTRFAEAYEASMRPPERRGRPRTGRLYSPDPRDVQAALESRGHWC